MKKSTRTRQGMKSYWSNFSPAQRSVEMRRRLALGAERRRMEVDTISARLEKAKEMTSPRYEPETFHPNNNISAIIMEAATNVGAKKVTFNLTEGTYTITL